jgi:hypothetical protein
MQEVDDILTVFTCLDEQEQLSNLPNYVSDNPDNMPSLRLYEGDLTILMDYLTKLDGKNSSIELNSGRGCTGCP